MLSRNEGGAETMPRYTVGVTKTIERIFYTSVTADDEAIAMRMGIRESEGSNDIEERTTEIAAFAELCTCGDGDDGGGGGEVVVGIERAFSFSQPEGME